MIRRQRDREGRKAITESPGRKDLRVTRARSGLRDPLVPWGFQVRREIRDMLGWPACRAQRAMPAREARQGYRDSRGIWALLDHPGLKDCGVCRDRLDLKAPKAIRALRGLRACRGRKDQLGLPRWI